jgi:hypothetical protein
MDSFELITYQKEKEKEKSKLEIHLDVQFSIMRLKPMESKTSIHKTWALISN